MQGLSPSDIAALNAWIQIQAQINRALEGPHAEPGVAAPSLASTVVGKFENLESIRLRWLRPGIFLFIPHNPPFAFVRPSGERIEPRRMFTDGGSIPRIMQWVGNLDPWGYAPAYLLHDWLYETHHCEVAAKAAKFSHTFADTNLVLMEAINTLIAMKLCPGDPLTKAMIATAVNSPIGKTLWNVKATVCPLPPDGVDD